MGKNEPQFSSGTGNGTAKGHIHNPVALIPIMVKGQVVRPGSVRMRKIPMILIVVSLEGAELFTIIEDIAILVLGAGPPAPHLKGFPRGQFIALEFVIFRPGVPAFEVGLAVAILIGGGRAVVPVIPAVFPPVAV